MNLHGLKADGNRFCGPAVLSMLTGLTAGECVAQMKLGRATQRRTIKGMTGAEMRRALELFSLNPKRDDTGSEYGQRGAKRQTVSQWRRGHQLGERVYVLFIKWHFVIVKGDTYYDSCYPEGRPLAELARRQVNCAWWVDKKV